MAARTPSLTRVEKIALNLIPPTGGARAIDLIKQSGHGARVALQRLAVKGLIEELGTPKCRIMRLTREGLQHPGYAHDGEHLASVEETITLPPALVKLMLALDALKEARAIDLTDVSGVKPTGRTGTGQYMQRLRTGGYVEQTKLPGEAPTYRLTKQGHMAISALKAKGRKISPAEATQRLSTARGARAAAQSEKQISRSISAVRNSRTPELLAMIAHHAGLTALDIRDRLSRPYRDRRSIYVALRDLERRGYVARIDENDAILWTITCAGESMLAKLVSGESAAMTVNLPPRFAPEPSASHPQADAPASLHR